MTTLIVFGKIVCSYGEDSTRKFADKFREKYPEIIIHNTKASIIIEPDSDFLDADVENGGVFSCDIKIKGEWLSATKKEIEEAYNKFVEKLNNDGWGLFVDNKNYILENKYGN